MKSILVFAALLSLSFQDICQFQVYSYKQYPNSNIKSFPDVQDFEYSHSSLISTVSLPLTFSQNHNEEVNDLIVSREANLHNHTFRNQLLANFNTTMLKKLRSSQPAMAF